RKRLPSWNYPGNARERALWVLDQKINDRGIAVDLPFAKAAVEAIGKATKRLNSHTIMLTDGAVDRANRRDQMLKHILAEYGV
ncbi:DNA polymerase, partial [Klebsiella pneumoniae]|nr:DNA polymerase [Klebsiella pneumoniae]